MHPTPPLKRAPKPDDPKVRFLVELARALGTYGTAADRIEEAVMVCAYELGLNAHIFSTPTSVFISIENDGDYETYLSRVTPGEVNLAKLRELDMIFNAVFDGKLSPRLGTKRIKEVVHREDTFPAWLHILSFGCVSATAAIFFGGGWRELAVSSLAGAFLGLLTLIIHKRREYARLFDFIAGFTSAVIAGAGTVVIGPYTQSIVILAALIVLIPGLTLTISLNELATRNVVSGSARLVGALMIFILLAFGAAVGGQVVTEFIPEATNAPPVPFGDGVKSLSAFVGSFFFVVLFRAKLSDWWVMTAAVLTSFYGSRFGVGTFGLEFGVCFAACCVGMLGNLFARIFDRPAVTVILPGLLMLVPGSVGFRSIQSLMGEETLTGIEGAFRVLVIGAALVVGLLLSNAFVHPRKVL